MKIGFSGFPLTPLLGLSILPLAGGDGSVRAQSEPGTGAVTIVGQPGGDGGVPDPAPVGLGDFSALKAGSPFVRVLDPAEKYVLRAVAEMDELKIATLQDRETKKTILVTPEEESDEGLQLVDVISGEDLEGVTAKITFAGEEVEFKYETSQIHPKGSGVSGKKEQGKGDERRRGPSKEDIERYKKLSDDQRGKLRAYIGHVMKSYPDLSREERGNMIRGAMIRLSDGRDLDFPKRDGQSN